MLLALPSICYVDFDVCLPLAPHDYKHQLPCCICCKTWQTCHCCPTKISVVLIKLRPSRSVLVTCGHWWPHDISPWPSSGWYQVQNSLRHPICLSAYVTPAFLASSRRIGQLCYRAASSIMAAWMCPVRVTPPEFHLFARHLVYEWTFPPFPDPYKHLTDTPHQGYQNASDKFKTGIVRHW